jgi:hypothetical protein
MWVNFADEHLFVAYASRLFAQDEIQVAEHPSLGHLKEKLVRKGGRWRKGKLTTVAKGSGFVDTSYKGKRQMHPDHN